MRSTVRIFFEGLYGNTKIDFVKGLIYIYPFGVIGKENNNKVKPHIHNNQFQIFLITEGKTNLIYNGENIAISAPSFITIPKNTEHGFEHQTVMKGWIISLSDVMLEHKIKRESEVINVIESFQIVDVLEDIYSEKIFKEMLECVDEFLDNKVGRLLMLDHMIGKIIVQLSRLPQESKNKIFNTNNSSAVYFRRFSHLIRESHSYKKTIEEYAAEMGITTGYLNRICTAIAEKSPKEVLINYFIAEAQLLLSDAEKTVNEVSYQIGFEDPSYFSRIFKKKIGYSPNEFRKKIGIK